MTKNGKICRLHHKMPELIELTIQITQTQTERVYRLFPVEEEF